MEKRHYDFVIGVLVELWNEPIDQKSTDQIRPRVVSEFHLGGKSHLGEMNVQTFSALVAARRREAWRVAAV